MSFRDIVGNLRKTPETVYVSANFIYVLANSFEVAEAIPRTGHTVQQNLRSGSEMTTWLTYYPVVHWEERYYKLTAPMMFTCWPGTWSTFHPDQTDAEKGSANIESDFRRLHYHKFPKDLDKRRSLEWQSMFPSAGGGGE
eukprot:scaffold145_cov261-Pinguiococcus_pyrenoidosus.AAC.31